MRRTRRIADLPLADRVFARALALGATSERPTDAAVDDLWRLAAGDCEALTRALGRLDHARDHVGHPGVIASALLRSALSYGDTLAAGGLEQAGGR